MSRNLLRSVAILVGIVLAGTLSLFFVVEPLHCEEAFEFGFCPPDVVTCSRHPGPSFGTRVAREVRKRAGQAQNWLDTKTGAHSRRWDRLNRDRGNDAGGATRWLTGEEQPGPWCVYPVE